VQLTAVGEQAPNYNYCRQLLRAAFETNELTLDYVYDWSVKPDKASGGGGGASAQLPQQHLASAAHAPRADGGGVRDRGDRGERGGHGKVAVAGGGGGMGMGAGGREAADERRRQGGEESGGAAPGGGAGAAGKARGLLAGLLSR
jgi:hypothetical protein